MGGYLLNHRKDYRIWGLCRGLPFFLPASAGGGCPPPEITWKPEQEPFENGNMCGSLASSE